MSKKDLIAKLTQSQIDIKKAFVANYIKANNASDGSIVDANANVSSKNIATLAGEFYKDFNIQFKRSMVTDHIRTMFGEELANEYNRQIEAHEIYIHDESNPFTYYCASVSLYPFLLNGLKDLGGESLPPKHLNSFCGSFINLAFVLSSQLAGAVATVEFLMYFDYFARKDYGENYLETNREAIEACFQQVIYSLNMPASARNFQSIFWNISIFDKYYFDALFHDFVFPDDNDTKPSYESLAKLQECFMTWFNKERTKSILTFPVVTAAMLTDEEGKVKDKAFKKMLCKQLSEGNSFFNYMSDNASALSSCCRLRNEMEENVFSYSLGAGGISTGSMNVITLNYNRFIQNLIKKDGNLDRLEFILKDQVEKIHKYQLATKDYLESFNKAGLMPIYSAGYISTKKQFLTVGINGVVEAAEFLGLEISDNEDYKKFIERTLKTIYDTNKEAKVKYKQRMNLEFVPAENLGVKNYNWDKKDGYVVPEGRVSYNSYLYKVEDTDIDIVDKFILHGRDNLKYLDGGSALHLNLEEYPSEEAYSKIFDLAGKTGCNYWTTNVKITICEDCGYIDKSTLTECPKCHSKNISYATRIIGYLKKVSCFSSERQKEESLRFYDKM